MPIQCDWCSTEPFRPCYAKKCTKCCVCCGLWYHAKRYHVEILPKDNVKVWAEEVFHGG
jgi:hypothetical protein